MGSHGAGLKEACLEFLEVHKDIEAGKPSAATPKVAMRAGYCAGFVGGMFFGDADRNVCWPEGAEKVTSERLVRIVVNFLVNNPAQLEAFEGVVVYRALSAHFPCPLPEGG